MTATTSHVGLTFDALAGLLESSPAEVWDAATLCAGWQVRHVIAHVTMPVRFTPEAFMAELAAAGGDFGRLSDRIAERDAVLSAEEHLAHLRSPELRAWQPPGGGAAGALSHAVIHSLDITLPTRSPSCAPPEAQMEVLAQLVATNPFGIDLSSVRLVAADADWTWRDGEDLVAESGSLVALLAGRTLPDGRSLRRV